jgi:cyclic pyranopterin phosphate synthase
MNDPKLTHIGADGNPKMVDVSSKVDTTRTAQAQSIVLVTDEIVSQLTEAGDIITKKGPVFHTWQRN